jgi:hypothetical protein
LRGLPQLHAALPEAGGGLNSGMDQEPSTSQAVGRRDLFGGASGSDQESNGDDESGIEDCSVDALIHLDRTGRMHVRLVHVCWYHLLGIQWYT